MYNHFPCSWRNLANSSSEIGGIGISAKSSWLSTSHVYEYTAKGTALTKKRPAKFLQK